MTQEVKYFIDPRQYKIFFVWDGFGVYFNMRLLTIGRYPPYYVFLYTRAGHKFEFTKDLARMRAKEPEKLKKVKMVQLNPSNKHLLSYFFVKLI